MGCHVGGYPTKLDKGIKTVYAIRYSFLDTKDRYIKPNKDKEDLLEYNYIKELLYYNKEDGSFYWLIPKKGRDLTSPAGTTNTFGYKTIVIDGHNYAQHRLAVFWMTGVWPPEYVDHIDGDPGNNQWTNLRLCSQQQNMQNKKRKYNSLTGVKGVVKDYRSGTWHVHMMSNGVPISRGPFYSYEVACAEYDRLASENFGEFARKETPRAQRASFNPEDVTSAIEDFICQNSRS